MESNWIANTINKGKYSELIEDLSKVEVCIVGAGIFGLSVGYYLAKNGINVVILEKEKEIGMKTSGLTTGKITSQHGLIYKYLIESYGYEYAKNYLQSNENAIGEIFKIINEEKIECDFKIQDSYLYTSEEQKVNDIKEEIKAVNSLKIINAEFQKNLEIPLNTFGAIKFSNQAQFHPRKYMIGLANAIIKYGGKIYTNSTVEDIKIAENGYNILTNNKVINSNKVVLATRYPILNFPGFYFTKMYQEVSYAMAIDTKCELFEGMYRDVDSSKYSFRCATDNGKKILLIGGLSHKTGEERNLSYIYNILETKAKEYYPLCKILYKWNTEDCITLDKIPYIGEYSNLMKDLYIATGFKKWGMTMSNVAANIIYSKIKGEESEVQKVYNSTRMNPIKNYMEVKNMISEAVNGIIVKKFKVKNGEISDIANDTGKIIKIDGENIGVYKDPIGKIYAVKPYCTHLGCLLTWNELNKSWDCPCHGSRFDFYGKNIDDPAIKSLEKYDIE